MLGSKTLASLCQPNLSQNSENYTNFYTKFKQLERIWTELAARTFLNHDNCTTEKAAREYSPYIPYGLQTAGFHASNGHNTYTCVYVARYTLKLWGFLNNIFPCFIIVQTEKCPSALTSDPLDYIAQGFCAHLNF